MPAGAPRPTPTGDAEMDDGKSSDRSLVWVTIGTVAFAAAAIYALTALFN